MKAIPYNINEARSRRGRSILLEKIKLDSLLNAINNTPGAWRRILEYQRLRMFPQDGKG